MAPKDLASVTINYSVNDGQRHWFYMCEQHKEAPFGGSGEGVQVVVHDARAAQAAGHIDFFRNGMQLVPHHTRITTEQFYDMAPEVAAGYYAEMCDAVKQTTGAAHVVALPGHQVRNQVEAAKRSVGKMFHAGQSVAGYGAGPHTDYDIRTADATYLDAVRGLPEYHKGRYVIVGTWRNIGARPIQQDHLALCDATTLILPDDAIVSELHLEGMPTYHQYRINNRNASRHRWWYYPDMRKDELLIFKQFDSDPTAGRFSFHSSITDPSAPSDAPTRESIEFRCVALFPDADVDSCPPQPAPSVDESLPVSEVVDLCVKGVSDARFMKAIAPHIATVAAARAILAPMVGIWAKQGHMGLKGAPAQKQTEVVEALTQISYPDTLFAAVSAYKQQAKM